MLGDLLTPWLLLASVLIPLIWAERWIHSHLYGVGWLLTNSERSATTLYYFFLMPGILVHEVTQWLVAGVLGVEIKQVAVWPEPQKDSTLRLDFVQIKQTDRFRSAIMGAAPLATGIFIVWYISTQILNLEDFLDALSTADVDVIGPAIQKLGETPDFYLWLYVLFAISNAMLPTPADRQGWPLLIGIFGGGLGFLVLIGLQDVVSDWLTGPVAHSVDLLTTAFLAVLFVEVLAIFFLGFFEEVLERITKRKFQYYTPPPTAKPREPGSNLPLKPGDPLPSVYNLALPVPNPSQHTALAAKARSLAPAAPTARQPALTAADRAPAQAREDAPARERSPAEASGRRPGSRPGRREAPGPVEPGPAETAARRERDRTASPPRERTGPLPARAERPDRVGEDTAPTAARPGTGSQRPGRSSRPDDAPRSSPFRDRATGDATADDAPRPGVSRRPVAGEPDRTEDTGRFERTQPLSPTSPRGSGARATDEGAPPGRAARPGVERQRPSRPARPGDSPPRSSPFRDRAADDDVADEAPRPGASRRPVAGGPDRTEDSGRFERTQRLSPTSPRGPAARDASEDAPPGRARPDPVTRRPSRPARPGDSPPRSSPLRDRRPSPFTDDVDDDFDGDDEDLEYVDFDDI
ncbi:MAG: hypothetical protein GYB65_14120 [Chloroflexi bacterium]|nr:hypothetical protein [Chloroflexota bacterium]